MKQIIDKKKKLKKELLKDYSILLQHLYHIKDSDKTKNLITFQRAHMDEVYNETEMTPTEWGNVLADNVASNNINYVKSRCKNLTHFVIDFSDFIQQDIKPRLSAHIVDEDGLVHLTSLTESLKRNHLDKYTSDRSIISEKGNFWTNTTYELAIKVWNLKKGDIAERSSAIQNIFNKLC